MERPPRQFIVRDFRREHIARQSAYPEGFLPTDQSSYDVHQGLEEITPDLLLSLLSELPDNFCDAEGVSVFDTTNVELIKNIEKVGKSIIITELSVCPAWTNSRDVAYSATVTLIAHIFFPGVVSVVDQANILRPFSGTINWAAITNDAATGIVSLPEEGSSTDMPVTITLPKTQIATEEEHRSDIIQSMPLIQQLMEMEGQRFFDVNAELPGLIDSSKNRLGKYMIEFERIAVSDAEALKQQALQYQKYFETVVQLIRNMAIEIMRQNRMDTKLLRQDILSGVLPQQPGVYSDTNILSFFKQEQT